MKNDTGFSKEEREAMKERARELRNEAKRAKAAEKAAADEADVLKKIDSMPAGDKEMAQRVHDIVTTVAPDLAPKLYYGQPGYARDGKVVCFFRSGQMDKERYSTFGFSMHASLDNPQGFWPTAYALQDPTEDAWQELTRLVEAATATDS